MKRKSLFTTKNNADKRKYVYQKKNHIAICETVGKNIG
jgi:hypothetical protein